MFGKTVSRCAARKNLPAVLAFVALLLAVSLYAQESTCEHKRPMVQPSGRAGDIPWPPAGHFVAGAVPRRGGLSNAKCCPAHHGFEVYLPGKYPDSAWLTPRNRHQPFSGSYPAYGTNQSVTDDSVNLAWIRQYASERAPGWDQAGDIAVDDLGNVYVTGYSTTLPYGVDYLTVKYNNRGEEVWVLRYDGPDGGDDISTAIAVDASGNVYVTGYSEASETSFDCVTIKYAKDGTLLWVARYNGPQDHEDRAVALKLDGSGNIYVTGSSGAYPNNDFATVKYNASGVEQWAARYDGPGNESDFATSLAIDDSGNVYVSGTSTGTGTSEDYATVKYNSSGIQKWVARYNGPGNRRDNAAEIAIDGRGSIYVTGASVGSNAYSDYATVKYDRAGVEQWVARYNGPANDSDYARSMAVDHSGNVYVTGGSWAHRAFADYATIKYDSAGVQQWVDRYNGPISDYDVASTVVLDDAGNVYVTGESRKAGSVFYAEDDYATIKYNSAGVRQWVARYNGPGNGYDEAHDLTVDDSGNVYVTGRSNASCSCARDYDFATLKYDSGGVQEWVARYSGVGGSNDDARDFVVDGDGNVYVTGFSEGQGTLDDYATLKYDTQGEEQWAAFYNGPGNYFDWANAVNVDHLGNVYVTGTSEGSGTRRDFATIRYDSKGVEQWVTRYNAPGNLPDEPVAIEIGPSGSVYVAGSAYHTSSGVDADYTTIKYSSNGVEQWVARYDGPANSLDQVSALALDTSENIYVTGWSDDLGYNQDYATIKYNDEGVQLWQARYNGPANAGDWAEFIDIDNSGNVYVAGTSWGPGRLEGATIKYDANGTEQWIVRDTVSVADLAVDLAGEVYVLLHDLTVVKYDPNGEKQWLAPYSAPGQQRGHGISLAFDIANNVYALCAIGFYSDLNNLTLKYSSTGERRWVAGIEGWRPQGIAVDDLGNIYAAGSTSGIIWSTFTLTKYVQSESVQSISGAKAPREYSLFQNYPNPFNYGTTIRYAIPEPGHVTLRIYNLLGEEIATVVDSDHIVGVYEVAWADARAPSGVYVYRLQSRNGFSETQKLLVLK